MCRQRLRNAGQHQHSAGHRLSSATAGLRALLCWQCLQPAATLRLRWPQTPATAAAARAAPTTLHMHSARPAQSRGAAAAALLLTERRVLMKAAGAAAAHRQSSTSSAAAVGVSTRCSSTASAATCAAPAARFGAPVGQQLQPKQAAALGAWAWV